jgi:predicted ATPase
VEERPRLAEVLNEHKSARGMSLDQLVRASGLPRATVHRWLRGQVATTYYWDHLLRLARALHLTRAQTNRLLAAAGMPPLHRLTEQATTDEERDLLAHWVFTGRLRLPAQLTSFIGREEEIAAISELLSGEDVRLVTLTGTGGTGKTRLALRVAFELHDLFPDGVTFVPLATVSDATQVLPAIARTLELREAPSVSIGERLAAYLRLRRTLLVLDNLEQAVAAGPEIVHLLRAAAGVKVIATSRVPLHVSGEHERPVPPFNLPPESGAIDVRNPAIALFIERARSVRPDFPVLPAVVRDIAVLCRQMDGLPLAIELTAARCRSMLPGDLLRSFPRLLDLPADGPRDVHTRHQTLRDTLAWSYALLAHDEQCVFSRLSVFAAGSSSAPGARQAGGWTLEAAAGVCRLGGETHDVNAALRALEDAHLVERIETPDDAPRYRMLQLIREFASERLAASRHEAAVRERHAQYFLARVTTTARYIPQAQHPSWFVQAEYDLADHRAALRWARSQPDPGLYLRYTSALWPFWHEYGYIREGYTYLRDAVERCVQQAVDPADLAQALTGIFLIGHGHGEFATATAAGEEALDIWERLGDQYGIALVRQYQGWASYTTGNIDLALTFTQQAIDAWRLVAEPAGIARCLGDLALILGTYGRFSDAEPYAAEALALYSELNDILGLARMYTDIGVAALLQGDLSGALEHLREATHLASSAGRNYILPSSQLYYGTALTFAGQVADALPHLAASLRAREDTGDTLGLTYNLCGCIAAAHRLGHVEHAAQLCGAVSALLANSSIVMVPTVHALVEQEAAALRAALDPEHFDDAFRAGQLLTLTDAVALAASVVSPADDDVP